MLQCPKCGTPDLVQRSAHHGTLVDLCAKCYGLWLDQGEILEFCRTPRELEASLAQGLLSEKSTSHSCPRCATSLSLGRIGHLDVSAEQCSSCEGLWLEHETVRQLENRPDMSLRLPSLDDVRATASEWKKQLASVPMALPNLVLRSVATLVFLYGLLTLVLIALAMANVVSAAVGLLIGVSIILIQFALGPWIMDLMLKWVQSCEWVGKERLPKHLQTFVEEVCGRERMKFPSFGIIHDGSPTAFTYGHHPNNARVVISDGLIRLLSEPELEAVVAHELGHARNWDMALMTVANMVPLILYFIYDFCTRSLSKEKNGGAAALIGVGAYVLYVVSEYTVLWFSRTREYYADRFAGNATQQPNALASALVKIAYGLASLDAGEGEGTENGDEERRKAMRAKAGRVAAINALNIFDSKAARSMVMTASSRTPARAVNEIEQVKGAMQWDLWNPWAWFYEVNSTHPLPAKRLEALGAQAAHMGQEPFVLFDREKPESYWDEFLVDVMVMLLPLAMLIAGGVAFAITRQFLFVGFGILACGLASLFKTRYRYPRDFFPRLSTAALLSKVKVSAMRPVPVTLQGKVLGRGVPGLIYSEDWVMQDRTGIMFLDYQQPLGLWNFFFGLLRSGSYIGKEIEVQGWYRRAPQPYVEINRLAVVDKSLPDRGCYTYHMNLVVGAVGVGLGIAMLAATYLGYIKLG